ncbi:MAG: hypothetical protein M1839_008588 [Geoglossum umbratile]|nr:MAG: hypothetical protein M1839_008588 [Geoglossum umbratile]
MNPPKCPTCQLRESVSSSHTSDLEEGLRALQKALENEQLAHRHSIEQLNGRVWQLNQQEILLKAVSDSTNRCLMAYRMAYNELDRMEQKCEDLMIALGEKEGLLLHAANELRTKDCLLSDAANELRVKDCLLSDVANELQKKEWMLLAVAK